MQFQCEYEHDQDDTLMALAMVSNIDDSASAYLSDAPDLTTSSAGTPRTPADASHVDIDDEKHDLTEREENAESLNFLVSVWQFERAFLADYKARHPGPLSRSTRFQIKRDAFTAAEMAMSSIRAEFTIPDSRRNPSARDIRCHYRALRPARRSLASRLLV
jgi:hypothetical protein